MLWAVPAETLAEEVPTYEENATDCDLDVQAGSNVAEDIAQEGEDGGIYGVDMFAYVLVKPGDSGSNVKEIQRRLADLGYFNNSITGNYGSITRDAVRAFQIRCGLDADGIVGKETYERLFADDAPIARPGGMDDPDPTTSPAPTEQTSQSTPVPDEQPDEQPGDETNGQIPDFSGVLSTGSRGDAVKKAQKRLIALGYMSSGADGIYGSGTAKAVKSFQIKCGISASGTINFETHIRLYADDAPHSGNGSKPTATPAITQVPTQAPTQAPTAEPTIIPTGAPTAVPTEAPTELPTEVPTGAPVPEYPGLLKYGSKGAAVKALQNRLVELGYLTGSVDGAFGSDTRNAVRAFQGARGLKVTGEVDETTHNAIYGKTPDKPDGGDFVELKKGMSGEAVKTLQQRLKELGYYKGSLQGTFGELTEAALMDFQFTANLTRTGVLDRATYELIYSPNAPYKDYDDDDYTELKQGDSGEDVKRLQKRLIELGYMGGGADGVYGSSTTSAIKAFQTMNKLTASGVATVETQQRLYSNDAIAQGGAATPAPSATPAPTAYPTLKTGSVGAAVKSLQRRLIELGYLNDKADGAYGARTASAVKSFQIKLGLSATGIADSQTQIELYRSDAPSKDYAGEVTPLPTATPIPTATADPNVTPTPAPEYILLKEGSTGPEVKALQERLKELGYYTGSISSVYDSATTSAVKSFQKANSLSVDGAAGINTQTRLFSDDAISKDEAGDNADIESNYPNQVPGTPKKPVINDIVSMDWFENVDGFFNRSSGTFKVGATAVVTDVKTGICYTVRRLGGSNHADVEPLTAFDAWQMYRIYNKNWSWTRRAAVVTVGGKNIAASINGMPHGGENISNNSFVGHSCIHFTNSRTHGTNRVDPDHQAAVNSALNADVSSLNSRIQNQ